MTDADAAKRPLTTISTPGADPDVFTTGLPAVDTELNGGLPAGAAVALTYPPASPGERLAYAQAVTPEHPTVYATTGHDTALIEGDLAAEHARYHPEADQRVDVAALTTPEADDGYTGLLEHPRACLPEFTGGSIVIDSITDYPPTDLQRHLPTLTEFLRETNSIAYLLLHPGVRPDRHRTTTDIADVVLEYEPATGGDTLHIPKFRHPPVNAPELPVTIDLTVGETVAVSTGKSH